MAIAVVMDWPDVTSAQYGYGPRDGSPRVGCLAAPGKSVPPGGTTLAP